jgi:hypothetical protein
VGSQGRMDGSTIVRTRASEVTFRIRFDSRGQFSDDRVWKGHDSVMMSGFWDVGLQRKRNRREFFVFKLVRYPKIHGQEPPIT